MPSRPPSRATSRSSAWSRCGPATARSSTRCPAPPTCRRLDELTSALRRWTLSVTPTGQLVVVHTPPGTANALARAIDAAQVPDIAGTVAGDDTIFVAARDGLTGVQLAEELTHHLEGDT